MKAKLLSILLLIAASFFISSCSVYMAAQKKGISPDELAQCRTRTCLLNKGAVTISQKTNKQQVLVEETFQVQKPTGSAARAVMHGVLDVSTLGIWEAVGTPVEGTLNKPDKYGVRVFYEADGETIKSVQLG